MNNYALENIAEPMDEFISLVGIWDWDIVNGHIRYNDAYLKMLGYSKDDLNGSIEEWKAMRHADDLAKYMQVIGDCLHGKTATYSCEIRVRHSDGRYIWMRDTGKVAARDIEGNPIRWIGEFLEIDELKHTKDQLAETLDFLTQNYTSLENTVKKHTVEMVEQGKLLWTVNQISKKLLVVQPDGNFDSLVQDCLCLLGDSIDQNRIYIWKDCIDDNGRSCCTQIYEWVCNVESMQRDVQVYRVPYDDLPTIRKAIDGDSCLNCRLEDFSDSEKGLLAKQGIKTILIAPIAINGKRWGFIGVDNCENNQLFTNVEENMLLMSGSILASAIERTETEAELREMEERTQMMLNAMPLCCNLWSPDFCNLRCNDEAVRLFELSSQEEYLERFFELSPKYQPCGRLSNELAVEYITKAFTGGYWRFEWLHQKIDGTPIPAEITLVRIKYKDGFIVAGYTRDLREQKAMLEELKTKEALRVARDEALLNSKAKSNFLANMSHEIRTPMNAISGFAEIILRESTGKTVEYANGIKNACRNLINIVDDILDISKIESGKLELFSAPYEFASLLNEVITISRMRLADKRVMFVTDIDSRLPAWLIGDEMRIKQILLNLLSNAIKYTDEGYVAFRVFGSVEKNKVILNFSVKDSGSGIKEEDLKRLFEDFERVNTTKNRSVEGTGLGLAISKRLCEMIGGQIKVESEYGKGSEFVAVIPQEYSFYERLAWVKEEKKVLLYEPRENYRFSVAESLGNLGCKYVSCANQAELYGSIGAMQYDYVLTAALYRKKVQAIMQQNNLLVPVAVFAEYGEVVEDEAYTIFFPVNCLQLSALLNGHHEESSFFQRSAGFNNFIAPTARVLIVDDNPVNLQVAKGLMEPYQFEIDIAINGLEAVRMVKCKEYDVVFMDHMMPEMDGVDATAAIRNLEGDRYLTLPIVALTANAFVGTREMFIREGMNDFLAKPIETNKLAHILLKWLPKSKIIKGDFRESVKVVDDTSDLKIDGVNTKHGLTTACGSKEAYMQILSAYHVDGNEKYFSLSRHIEEDNIVAFRIEVHALKSASAAIGAVEVSALAEKLEIAAKNNDVAFIITNIDKFLKRFKGVLDAISPVLSDESDEVLADSRPPGEVTYLQRELDVLKVAAEFANIRLIEAEINKLQEFTWSENVTKEFVAMRQYMKVFDYDGVLDCVMRLRNS